jgi:hypothetical protein
MVFLYWQSPWHVEQILASKGRQLYLRDDHSRTFPQSRDLHIFGEWKRVFKPQSKELERSPLPLRPRGGLVHRLLFGSHPWLSSLDTTRSIFEGGFPVFLLASFIEFLAVATVINPRGRWAFNLASK